MTHFYFNLLFLIVFLISKLIWGFLNFHFNKLHIQTVISYLIAKNTVRGIFFKVLLFYGQPCLVHVLLAAKDVLLVEVLAGAADEATGPPHLALDRWWIKCCQMAPSRGWKWQLSEQTQQLLCLLRHLLACINGSWKAGTMSRMSLILRWAPILAPNGVF